MSSKIYNTNNISDLILPQIFGLYPSFQHVSVNQESVEKVAKQIISMEYNYWDKEFIFKDMTERSLNYLGLFVATSFSYWHEPKWHKLENGQEMGGSYSLLLTLKEMISKGYDITDASVMSSMSYSKFKELMHGDNDVEIPYLKERYKIMQEIGNKLESNYEGLFLNLFKAAQFDASKIASLLFTELDCFKDIFYYKRQEVFFLKKAQEFVSMVYEQFKGIGYGDIKNMERLTASSDYRLPQILNSLGVLVYSDDLKNKVINKTPLPGDSTETLELRMSTILACFHISQSMSMKGHKLSQFEISNLLWTFAQNNSPDMLTYPRINSVFV